MSRSFSLFIFSIVLFFGCGKKTTLVKSDIPAKSFKIKEADFAKSKIKYEDKNSDLKTTANIRMKKDSIIWLSLSAALGIEAVRGMITTDSVAIIDRINKKYINYDYKTLSEKFNFNIDFELIQAVLLGNLPLPLRGDEKISKSDIYFLIKQKGKELAVESYVNRSSLKLEKVLLKEEVTKNTLSLAYRDFQLVGDFFLPFSNFVELKYTSKGNTANTTIDINFNKAELVDKELRFPFNIPQKYTRK